ncbi:MAG: hypothetical protein V4492_06515 [Chlamydiota bacterium]
MATTAIKNGLGIAVRFLNQPVIKEGAKNIASTAAFSFGLIEAYDIYQILRGKEISTEINSSAPQWVQTAAKASLICTKISLILSAATSRPGVLIISAIVGCVFSTNQLERFFRPNAIFAVNPWHPRHVFSIAACLLALPSVIQSIRWAHQPENTQSREYWLTDTKIRMMALFNTVASRPAQHLGNQLFRAALRI